MPGSIPESNFRLDHGFAIKPELRADQGPAKSILVGRNSPLPDIDALYLGKQAETPYRDVWLDTRGAHVIYVMGKRRSGKSFTLGILAEGLAAKGWLKQGSMSQGVLILDTMNVFLTMPFGVQRTYPERSDTVKELRKWKLEAEDITTTLFHPAGTIVPEELEGKEITLRPADLAPEDWCGLFEADPFADPLGHLIAEVHAKVSTDGYTDSGTAKYISPNPMFNIEDLLTALDRDGELQRYHPDTRESLRRRLQAMRRLPLFSTTGLDVRELLRPGHISVLLLRELDHQVRAVMVGLIVRRVMQLRGLSEQHERMIPIHLARAEKFAESDPTLAEDERRRAKEAEENARAGLPRSWIIIDEAHNYVPVHGTLPSRRVLKKYCDEGRNLGLSIVVATQQPSGLDPSLQRNADIVLIHALSHHADLAAAEGMVNTATPSEAILDGRYKITGARVFESLVRDLPLGYALVSTDRANRLFPLRIRPRLTVHGGVAY